VLDHSLTGADLDDTPEVVGRRARMSREQVDKHIDQLVRPK